ncbi:hypothetical protein BH09VER1_BH09VER1_46720 [soil metagenome]
MDYYYTDSQNQSKGPVGEEEIKSLVASGVLNGTTMICAVGTQQWVPVGTLVPTAAPPLPVTKNEPLAIWSFVLSLIICCEPITAIAAVICGHIALSKYKKNPGLQGKGLATAGVIIGYVLLAVWVLMMIFGGMTSILQAVQESAH